MIAGTDTQDAVARIVAAVEAGREDADVYALLAAGLRAAVGFRVLTVLKIDTATLRSIRLYSSEASYPVGGTKQHPRNAWSEAVLDRHEVFMASDLAALRANFADSAAIEATGCGSIIAVPILGETGVLGTMNLWHEDGFYDVDKAARARPFAAAIAPLCTRGG